MFVLNTIGRAELNTRTNGGCGSGGDAGSIPVCVWDDTFASIGKVGGVFQPVAPLD